MTLDYWQRVVNGETDNYNHELRMIKKDGTVIWTDVRGHAVRNDEGQLTHLFGATVDISGRKEVQDALIQSEHQLRIVLDALPVGVWFTDRSGKPLLSNPAAKQIWSNIRQIGLQTLDNPSGWWETIGAANEPHRWALSNTLATGAPSLNETFDFECLDGTKKTIRNSTVPVQDEKGVVVGAIIVNEDITALRQAQEALKLTQFSVDQAVEGFLWISPDARILHVNDAACRMLEYSHDELTGMTLPDIDPNFLLEAWSVHWDECKQKGSLTFETKHWSRTGRILDMEVTFNYLRYEEKEYNCAIMRDIGERKRADAALRASEERFRELYDDTPTMYFTLAMDGTVRSVNRFGAEQLGYQVEELIGSSVLGVFHKDDKETVAANLSECLSTPGTTRHWEFRKVRKDRSIIWVWETARVGQSSTGETVVLVTCEDITARKQAEQAVTLFRVLLDQADDSIEIIDPATGRFLDSNEMAFSSLGYTSQEHRLLTVPDIDPIVTAPLFAQSIARIREYGSVTLETVHRRKDGSTFPVEVKARLVQLDREYLLAIVRDITDRKKAEEALQASEARLRLVLDTLPAAAFTCDTDGSITYFNKRAFDLWGCSPELNHFENRSCSSLKFYLPDGTPVPHDQCCWMVMEVKEGRTVHGNEIVIERPDGHRRSVLAHANMLRDQDGHIAGTVNVLIDITEQKRMEEALRQRERDLRAAIEERERISQDLHDGILQSLFAVGLTLETAKSIMPLRTRKMSGPPLDQAIDQLNRVMHEIRNFIAGLGLDLFRGGDLPTALEHMLASLTKNQATRVRLAVEDRAARAISAEQALHLLLVIQEAVTNCIRHGRAQEATVSFKMLKRGVRLSIHDNGHGFNPEVATGTGHGLRNMAARAKKIGGRFTITSKVDEGTRIILDLPKEASDVLR
jgi:PAS domain S-box-containing protein